MKDLLIKGFKEVFNLTDGVTYFSPARVNLIGEHVDYNGGFVFPCALSFGTYGIAKKRNDQTFNVYSKDFSQNIYSFNLNELVRDEANDWVDYVKGVIKALIDNNHKIDYGFDLYIIGNMPSGAGLSSSASLESLIVTILNDFLGLNLSLEQKALIGKEAENKFVGVSSGIMDQFAVLAGKKDHAILLNTQNLSYEYAPLKLGSDALVIVNTNKKRGLADSKYNERFNECQQSLSILKPVFGIKDLCELSVDKLNDAEKLLTPTLFKRVKHVVTEQARTIKSTTDLANNNIQAFADLMTQSHNSLRDDYDVTGVELDTLQELMLLNGAKGARMTGAGFGGCVVAIVPKNKLESLTTSVTKSYEEKIGYKPSFYSVEPEDGTKTI